VRTVVTGAIASFGTGFDRRAPATRRGGLIVVWRVERHTVIVVGRRGGLGGDEVQPADRLGRQPARRPGSGHRLLDGDMLGPVDADRQVLLPEGDNAPA
jgi:hypothetical protein